MAALFHSIFFRLTASSPLTKGLIAVLVLSCCAAAADAGHDLPSVFDSAEIVISDDASDTLIARRLTFAEPIRTAAYDSSSGVLLVSYGAAIVPAGSGQKISDSIVLTNNVAYDLEHRRVLWVRKDSASPVSIVGDHALLVSEAGGKLCTLSDGETLVDINGEILIAEEAGLVVGVADRSVTAYAIGTGVMAWRVDREDVKGPAAAILRDGKLILGAEGVQVIELASGAGWTYPLPASRRDLRAIGGGGGFKNVRTLGSFFSGKRYLGMNSAPLVDQGRIYFAADTTVVCLDLETGRCRWRRDLRRGSGFSLRERALGLPGTPEFLGRLLIREAGPNVAVASLGWAPGKNNSWWADPPTIALLSKSDGRLIRRVVVEGTNRLLDVKRTPEGNFLLAPDRVIVMDDRLDVRWTQKCDAEIGDMLGLFPCDRPVVMVSTGAITAIGPDSLAVSWRRRMGFRALWSDSWNRSPLTETEFESATSDSTGYRWVVSNTELVSFDPRSGCRPVVSYPLNGVPRARIQDRTIVILLGKSIMLLPLPRRGG